MRLRLQPVLSHNILRLLIFAAVFTTVRSDLVANNYNASHTLPWNETSVVSFNVPETFSSTGSFSLRTFVDGQPAPQDFVSAAYLRANPTGRLSGSFVSVRLSGDGSRIFALDVLKGLHVFDAQTLNLLGSDAFSGFGMQLEVDGNSVFVIGSHFIRKVDATDPTGILVTNEATHSFPAPSASGFDSTTGRLFVCENNVIETFDRDTLESVAPAYTVDGATYLKQFWIHGNYLYTSSVVEGQLHVLDVSVSPYQSAGVLEYSATDERVSAIHVSALGVLVCVSETAAVRTSRVVGLTLAPALTEQFSWAAGAGSVGAIERTAGLIVLSLSEAMYMPAYSGSLVVLDGTNGSPLATVDVGFWVGLLLLDGSSVWATGADAFERYSLTTPSAPAVAASHSNGFSGTVTGIQPYTGSDHHVLVLTTTHLYIYDINVDPVLGGVERTAAIAHGGNDVVMGPYAPYIYIAASDQQLHILRSDTPNSLSYVGSFLMPSGRDAYRLSALSADALLVVEVYKRTVVFDVTAREAPQVRSNIRHTNRPFSAAAGSDGTYYYVAGGGGGLLVVDVSVPAVPEIVHTETYASGIYVFTAVRSGDFLYVGLSGSMYGWSVYDVSVNPRAPSLVTHGSHPLLSDVLGILPIGPDQLLMYGTSAVLFSTKNPTQLVEIQAWPIFTQGACSMNGWLVMDLYFGVRVDALEVEVLLTPRGVVDVGVHELKLEARNLAGEVAEVVHPVEIEDVCLEDMPIAVADTTVPLEGFVRRFSRVSLAKCQENCQKRCECRGAKYNPNVRKCWIYTTSHHDGLPMQARSSVYYLYKPRTGCGDSTAINYNSYADVHDAGQCAYQDGVVWISGAVDVVASLCPDPVAMNYNPGTGGSDLSTCEYFDEVQLFENSYPSGYTIKRWKRARRHTPNTCRALCEKRHENCEAFLFVRRGRKCFLGTVPRDESGSIRQERVARTGYSMGFKIRPGCVDEAAVNFDSLATISTPDMCRYV